MKKTYPGQLPALIALYISANIISIVIAGSTIFLSAHIRPETVNELKYFKTSEQNRHTATVILLDIKMEEGSQYYKEQPSTKIFFKGYDQQTAGFF